MQEGVSCLLRAANNGHLDVVKHLCEVGGERLLMLTQEVRGRVAVLLLCICMYERVSSGRWICRRLACWDVE